MHYNNYEELKEHIVTPEEKGDRNDFIELCLTSDYDYSGEYLFTKNFKYDLNGKNADFRSIPYESIKIKAKILYHNILSISDKEKQSSPYKNIISNFTFLSFLKKLSTCSFDDFSAMCRREIDATTKNCIDMFVKMAGDWNKDFRIRTQDWYYFNSENMHPNRKNIINQKTINHRLYLAINYDQIINFCRDFILKLEEKNLPYNFKIKTLSYLNKAHENDTLVIYVDTKERVVEYVNILNDLIKGNPNYSNSIHTPSAHLGSIEDKIGYGVEFRNHRDKESYSTVVSKVAHKAMNSALKTALNSNLAKYHSISTVNELKKFLQISLHNNEELYDKDSLYNYFKGAFWENFIDEMNNITPQLDDSIIFNP